MRFFGLGKPKTVITLGELRKIFEEDWKLTPYYLDTVSLAKVFSPGKAELMVKNNKLREIYWGNIERVYNFLTDYKNFEQHVSSLNLSDCLDSSEFDNKYCGGLYSECVHAGDFESNIGLGAFKTYCELAKIFVIQLGKIDKNKKIFSNYADFVSRTLVLFTRKSNMTRSKKYQRGVKYFTVLDEIFRDVN
jgi:hypothetical protein